MFGPTLHTHAKPGTVVIDEATDEYAKPSPQLTASELRRFLILPKYDELSM